MAKTPPKNQGTSHDKPVTTAGQLDADKTPASGAGATGAPGSDQVAQALGLGIGQLQRLAYVVKGLVVPDRHRAHAVGAFGAGSSAGFVGRRRRRISRSIYRRGVCLGAAFGRAFRLRSATGRRRRQVLLAGRLGHLVTPAFETPEE